MKKLIWSTGSGKIEIGFTREQASLVPLCGDAEDGCNNLMRNSNVMLQFVLIADDLLAHELRQYGAWDSKQLSNRKDNIQRMIWLACCELRERYDF